MFLRDITKEIEFILYSGPDLRSSRKYPVFLRIREDLSEHMLPEFVLVSTGFLFLVNRVASPFSEKTADNLFWRSIEIFLSNNASEIQEDLGLSNNIDSMDHLLSLFHLKFETYESVLNQIWRKLNSTEKQSLKTFAIYFNKYALLKNEYKSNHYPAHQKMGYHRCVEV